MTNEIEGLFLYLEAIWHAAFLKYRLKCFAHFSSGLLVWEFLLCSCDDRAGSTLLASMNSEGFEPPVPWEVHHAIDP